MQTIYHKKVAKNVCPIKKYSTVADQLSCLNNSYQCSRFFLNHHYLLFKDLEALFGEKNTRLAMILDFISLGIKVFMGRTRD